MWTYYGSKANIVDHYPSPKHDKVIEPFAGTARYSLKWFEKEVLLIEKYDVVVGIWKWLQQCSKDDIKRLPHFVDPGQSIDSLGLDCAEAKDLMGFLIGFGMERPRKTASVKRMITRPNHVNYSLNRIADNLFKIKHWKIKQGDYVDIQNQKATWFIDAPYQYGGKCYPFGSNKINYEQLAIWCEQRQGQVIVCENMKADWLNFKPMISHKTTTGMQSEGIWSNQPTVFDKEQLLIF